MKPLIQNATTNSMNGTKPPPRKRLLAIVVVVALVGSAVVGFIIYLHGQGPGPSTVTLWGTASPGSGTPGSSITNYGTAIGIGFVENATGNSFYFSNVTSGQYSITLLNYHSYAVLIDFQPPGRPSGTCSTIYILLDSSWGNTSLHYDWTFHHRILYETKT